MKRNCPVACATNPVCFEGVRPFPSLGNTVQNRIMRVGPNEFGEQTPTTCVAEGADPVGDCEALNLPSRSINAHLIATSLPAAYHPAGLAYLRYLGDSLSVASTDHFDCRRLQHAVDQACTFEQHDWMTNFSAEATDASGNTDFTINFWIKPAPTTAPYIAPHVEIFSSLAPPVMLLSVTTRPAGEIVIFIPNRCDGSLQNIATFDAVPQTAVGYLFVAVSFGALNSRGERELMLVLNSVIQFRTLLPWCEDTGVDSIPIFAGRGPRPFIAGYTVYSDSLISPIQLSPYAWGARFAQGYYYRFAETMSGRLGPTRSDIGRRNSRLSYTSSHVASSFFLVAPPIIWQKRVTPSIDCSTSFGELINVHLWTSALNVLCDESHVCPFDNVNDSALLTSCRGSDSPTSHLGRLPNYFGSFEE